MFVIGKKIVRIEITSLTSANGLWGNGNLNGTTNSVYGQKEGVFIN
jgi:hypothetical protein